MGVVAEPGRRTWCLFCNQYRLHQSRLQHHAYLIRGAWPSTTSPHDALAFSNAVSISQISLDIEKSRRGNATHCQSAPQTISSHQETSNQKSIAYSDLRSAMRNRRVDSDGMEGMMMWRALRSRQPFVPVRSLARVVYLSEI